MAVMKRKSSEWVEEYVRLRAYWAHSGDPRNKHAELTSGMHSNGFFESRLVVNDPVLLADVVSDLVTFVFGDNHLMELIDRVVGPGTGATKLAEAVAEEIGRRRNFVCRWASPKKGEGGTLYFEAGKEKVEKDEIVFLVEDVVTTGGSVIKAAKLCVDAGATPLDLLGCIVNRSGEEEVGGYRVQALVTKAMPMWAPNECPLCAAGSIAVPAKDNWDELIATH